MKFKSQPVFSLLCNRYKADLRKGLTVFSTEHFPRFGVL